MSKYRIGQPVEIISSRYQGEYYEYYPYNLKYREGQTGNIQDVYENVADIPEDLFDEYTSNGDFLPAGTYYNVKSGLSKLHLVPESEIKGVVNLDQKVEERIAKAQENKEFKDQGQRVGGTKKEKMAYKMVLMSDLADIEQNEQLAVELVKKDKVYPKVDVLKLQERGTSSGFAYLMVKLRENFPNKPQKNNPLFRKIYVGFAEYLSTAFDKDVTIENFESTVNSIRNNFFNKVFEFVHPELVETNEDELKEREKQYIIHLKMQELNDSRKQELFDRFISEDDSRKVMLSYAVLNLIMNSDSETAAEYRRLNEIGNNFKKTIDSLKNPFTFNESLLLEKIYGKTVVYFDRRYANASAMTEILGKTFKNFMYQSSDAASANYQKAREYTALSEEESIKLTFEESKGYIERLKRTEENLQFISSNPSREKITEFFDEHAIYCFSGGEFASFKKKGGKDFCWGDVKNSAPMIEAYIERYKGVYKKAIEQHKSSIEIIKEKYRQREEDWSWAFEKKAQSKERSELKANTGKPLQYIKRIGGLKVDDDNVNVEFLTETLGFKSITLGNYVKDNESREHIRHFIGAIVDLCELLNIDVKTLNGIKGLSMWFGAGGGGKAGAYYRSSGTVINLTKTRGDGAVAHEMAHYIDDCLGYIRNPEYTTDKNYGSVIEKGRYYVKNIKNPNVLEAMRAIYYYIHKRQVPVYVFGTQPFVSKLAEQIKQDPESGKVTIKVMMPASDKSYLLEKYGLIKDNIEDTIEAIISYYGNSMRYYENLSANAKSVLGYVIKKFGHKEYEIEFLSKSSQYYANSNAMSSDYWTRDWELFARAFETYIYDKLEKQQRANNYLVSGDYFDHELGVYPSGAEREDLYVLYDNLFYWIKKEYQLKDFVPFTEERTKEFIDLKNTKDEEVNAEVIVDEQPKKLTIEEKLMKLISMIKAANKKMEQGGEVDFYFIDTKEQSGILIEKKEDGGSVDNDLENSEKNRNFTLNICKNEIQHIVSGISQIGSGSLIQAASNYLRESKGTGSSTKESKHFKAEEAERLRHYIEKNDLWVKNFPKEKDFNEGAEQKVYLLDKESVLKCNNVSFYQSWEDYFNSLLLHNLFFPITSYKLIGFKDDNGELRAVVEQEFVEHNEDTDLELVKKFMASNGFQNTRNNDYYHSGLGIILEDLHEFNVLTRDGVLFFIDTVFYISTEPPKKIKDGGELTKLVGENPKVEDTPFTWNEEEFLYSKTDYDKKDVSPIIFETELRRVYLGGRGEVTAKNVYRIVKDKAYSRWLLLSELVDENNNVLLDSGAVGEYDFENLGILLSHRGKGVGRAFVKELIKRNQIRPSIGYSRAGYNTIVSALKDIEGDKYKKGGETFAFFDKVYDVDKAYKLINSGQYIYDIKTIPTYEIKHRMFNKEYSDSLNPDFSGAQGLMIKLPNGNDLLIDGNHRMNKAYFNGLKEMKVYYIDNPKTIKKFTKNIFKKGGELSSEDKNEIYSKWKKLVNMSSSELEKFYNSEEGKEAGLSKGKAKELGIGSGRQSARWILKMKNTNKSDWTPEMWKWANRQISFISRMSGNKGSLYDDNGNKTRKHTSLLIWGHNPEKKEQGGEVLVDEDQVIAERWVKKRESIQELANNIHRLRLNVTNDLKSENEKIFLTSLAVALMDKTSERVGNQVSEKSGHFGITGLRKKHITIEGNKVTLNYVGKSGVEHDTSFSDEKLARCLKQAMDNGKGYFVFTTSDGFRVKADRVNRYLSDFNITAKDIRAYGANKHIIERLESLDIEKNEKKRKTQFLKVLTAVSEKVGHGRATLRKHYMIPELEVEFIQNGKIIDIKNLGYYKQGGEVINK